MLSRPHADSRPAPRSEVATASPNSAQSRPSGRTDVVIIGDSLTFYGPRGGLPADDRRVWPNLFAAATGTTVYTVGRLGWTFRDAYWALIQDPQLWAHLGQAQTLILAVGGMDSLPSPLPTALRELLRYVRPARLRRIVRQAYTRYQPFGARWDWPRVLPAHTSREYLELIYTTVRAVRQDIRIILTTPSTHAAESYHYNHSGYAGITAMVRGFAQEHQLGVIDFRAATEMFFHDQLPAVEGLTDDERDALIRNPDGLHWGFGAHQNVAEAAVALYQGQS